MSTKVDIELETILLEKTGQIKIDPGFRPRPKHIDHAVPVSFSVCLLWSISMFLLFLSAPFTIWYCFKKVRDYQRVVTFRGGHLFPGGPQGPGIFFQIPCLDDFVIVDLRTVSYKAPAQELITKDGVAISLKASVFYHVEDPTLATIKVENYTYATELLFAATLRNVLGTKTLPEVLNQRDDITRDLCWMLDEATEPWGVKIERVEIQDVCLPTEIQLAMVTEVEALQEARAKVTAAEGEQNASRALKEAADIIAESPNALQLRYLQTLQAISAEKNSTIILPLPLNFLSGSMNKDKPQ